MFCETRLNFVNLHVVHCGEIDHTLVLCSGKLGCNFMDMYVPTIRVSHVNPHCAITWPYSWCVVCCGDIYD
jgi:hypothetical protein